MKFKQLVSGVSTGQAPPPTAVATATTTASTAATTTHGGVVASVFSSVASVVSSDIASPTQSSGAMVEAGVKDMVMAMAGAVVVAGIELL